MSYREVLALPARTFWFMAGCVIRILAEKDMRAVGVGAAVQSPEGVESALSRLEIEMAGPQEPGDPLKAERDQEGFNELKALAAAM